jgi:hypothetical protein
MLFLHYPQILTDTFNRLHKETTAHCVWFINKNGTLCGRIGDYTTTATEALRTTLRGSMLSTLHKVSRQGLAFQQHASYNTFFAKITDEHLLVLILPKQANIGTGKQAVQKAVTEINHILGMQQND